MNDSIAVEPSEEEQEGSFLAFVLKLALIVLLVRTFLASPFTIPSESMLPRLMNGDYLVAAKWPYGYSRYSLPFDVPLIDGRLFAGLPDRGDVVIFKHPVDGSDYVKRVIGLPGDTVELRDGRVVLNGKPVPQRRALPAVIPVSPNTGCGWGAQTINRGGQALCRYDQAFEQLPNGRTYKVLDFGATAQDDYGPVTVPEGRMFLLGDNRDNSQDSRFPAVAGGGVGLVPLENLVGRASIIAWSSDGGAEWLKPWTWFSAARFGRVGDVI